MGLKYASPVGTFQSQTPSLTASTIKEYLSSLSFKSFSADSRLFLVSIESSASDMSNPISLSKFISSFLKKLGLEE